MNAKLIKTRTLQGYGLEGYGMITIALYALVQEEARLNYLPCKVLHNLSRNYPKCAHAYLLLGWVLDMGYYGILFPARLQIRSGLHVVEEHRGFAALGMRMLCVGTTRPSTGPHPPGLIADVILLKLLQYCYLGYSKRPSLSAFPGEPVTQTMPLNHCACCWFWNKRAI
ncbi:hypothetical protein DFH08DRAFT_818580 [Mycena albidolilacea]|uniref:Uncharacterized protein n=1 Tax=Mycena albidolilacea TaxID=1033008 RepID=A0AAD6ZGC1_9AGAR|nr:hypothetical protein DFH08DRAFT_818580 [Mycena albidolilacea]